MINITPLEGILREVDARWRHLLSEVAATSSVPCVEVASEDWWLDPDLDEDGGRDENQLRAQLLCYDCPIVSECRRRGALEEFNVWGGLTAVQRRRLGKGLSAGKKRKDSPRRGGVSVEEVRKFKSGWTTEDLGLLLGQPPAEVLRHLVGHLGRVQQAWEERHEGLVADVSGLVRAARLAG